MANDKGYVNPQLLVSAKELIGSLNGGTMCVVDTRPTHEYVAGHIPGAIHLDVFGISLNDTSETPFKAFMWTIAYLFQSRGVDPKQTIVWYENTAGVRAARGFWFCEYFGHDDVKVLDGGFKAWVAAGGPVSTEGVEPSAVSSFLTETRPESHIDADAIHALLGQADFAVLDTRSADEHYARVARAARGGAIPGSIHIEWTNNLDSQGAFKPAADLRAMYEAAGVTPEKRVMCY